MVLGGPGTSLRPLGGLSLNNRYRTKLRTAGSSVMAARIVHLYVTKGEFELISEPRYRAVELVRG
jgi:hypothetical protein